MTTRPTTGAKSAAMRTAAHDLPLHVDLMMSTHLTVVVRACVEFSDGAPPLEVALVIARRRCQGNRPTRRALHEAGREWLDRWQHTSGRQRGRLRARVDGRWQTLVETDELRLAA